MPFQMRYNVLFRQFRLLTAQAGSIPAAIRLIFENCYKGNTAQFPPCGLSTAPAAAAPRSPYRHLELCGIALYLPPAPILPQPPHKNKTIKPSSQGAAGERAILF